MRVGIIDDIEEYRTSIRLYAENFFKNKNLDYQFDEFSSPKDLLANEYKNYDIFFVDIEFGEKENGIDLIRQLNQIYKNAVFIIVTSYNQYLDDAFDLKVLRFINKPIYQERIDSALEKAVSELSNSVISLTTVGGEKKFVNQQLIVFAEARYKKTYVKTVDDSFFSPIPFKDFKKKLHSSDFLIPHNSYVVNKNYIVSFKSKYLSILINSEKILIPISATKQSLIRKQFQER